MNDFHEPAYSAVMVANFLRVKSDEIKEQGVLIHSFPISKNILKFSIHTPAWTILSNCNYMSTLMNYFDIVINIRYQNLSQQNKPWARTSLTFHFAYHPTFLSSR